MMDYLDFKRLNSSAACHKYQVAVERYGLHANPILDSSLGKGCLDSDFITRQPSRTPKSSTGKTSGRSSVKIRNISTVQRPIPRSETNRETSSSSVIANAALLTGTTPSRVPSAIPRIVVTLVVEKPQARSIFPSVARMLFGDGKDTSG